MTEYGRGPGSEPWHPQDPLYPDPGWDAHHGQQPPNGGWEGHHGQQAPNGGWDGHHGQYASNGGWDAQYGQYAPNGGWDTGHGQHTPHGGWDPYGAGATPHTPQHGYPQHPHAQHYPGHDTSGYPPASQQGYPAGSHGGRSGFDHGAPYGHGAPETGHGGWHGAPGQGHQGAVGGEYGGYDGYGAYPGAAPHGGAATAQGGHDTWSGQQHHDPYAPAPEQHQVPQQGYPSTGIRRPRRDGGQQDGPGPDADPETGWDPGPDQGEHDFFRRRDDEPEDEGEGDDDGGGRPRRRRSGCACFGAAVLLIGLLGVGAYFGKQFYDSRFGAPEDYSGEGNGEEVQVEIPEGASLVDMGNVLHEAGVVASVAAFTDAAEGENIQPGYYTLYAEMSAESAVDYLTDPEMLNALVIPEGLRAAEIYEAIDSRLGLEEGATEDVATSGDIDLPEWAETDDSDVKDPLEGFLFPARYDIGDETDPEALLQTMVDRAAARYEDLGVEDTAGEHDLDDPRDLITVASLVQAEGITYEDFQQMAEVVYNRLAPDNDVTNRRLEFDSAYNYLMGQSEIVIPEDEINSNDDPYNTYYHAGLPPGPINSPGDAAVEAALDPTDEGWMFFISIDGETTTFTKTHEEHEELREEFNERLDISGTS